MQTSEKPGRKAFGGYQITCDDLLARLVGVTPGTKLAPSKLTKALWDYIKRNNLGGK